MSEKRTGLGRGLDALLPGRRPGLQPSAGGGQQGSSPHPVAQEQEQRDKGGAQTAPSVAVDKHALAGAREIAVELIERNPYQTRGKIDEAALEELAASIREQGVLQPILVRQLSVSGSQLSGSSQLPASSSQQEQNGASSSNGVTAADSGGRATRELSGQKNERGRDALTTAGETPALHVVRYQLMAGERRWMAAQRAGLKVIPAVVKQVGDEQAMEITIIENLQREDLNAMEQARAFERLSREFRLTQEVIALKTGKDRASIGNFLRLLKLPAAVQRHIENDALSMGHGKVLMMLQSEPAEMVERVAQKCVDEGWSVRELEEKVTQLMSPQQAPAEKKADLRDPNVKEAERELQRSLGCKVTIKDRGGRGRIVLEYATLEDFDRIVEVLGAK